jgi:predicted transcriptional regulator YdeE
MKENPRIITMSEPIRAAGLITRTSMKTVFKDLPVVYRQYMGYTDQYEVPEKKIPWEYVSLSKNFAEDKTWDYCTGHVVTGTGEIPEVFTAFEVPAGKYAVFPIKSRFRFMLGLAIGRTKRYIYGRWIPKSRYEFADYEFEYNNEKMFQENPNYIDLYVAVKDRNEKCL